MIKRENFINVTGWMVSDLKLKGNELLIYAIIYGFSQDNESKFTGSLGYLAEWTNSTKQGVLKALKSLLEKGLISKKEEIKNGVKFCEYTHVNLEIVLNKVELGIKQNLTGYLTKFNGGIKQSLTNNITNNIEDKKEEIIEPEKRTYGEFANVFLDDKSYGKLLNIYGEDRLAEAIEIVSSYVQSTGKKYKDFYAVLGKHNWVYPKVMGNKSNKQKEEYNEVKYNEDGSVDPNSIGFKWSV